MNMLNEFITAREAQHILGVSHAKMTRMLKDGEIRYRPNPLDKRVKLVSRTEVEALLKELEKR